MRVALITAILGNYDFLKSLPTDEFDDAVCVTDDPTLKADGWRTVVTSHAGSPRLTAKLPKMRPNEFVDADVWVWVDGQIQVNPGLRKFAVTNLGDAPIAAFQHPERDCIFDEGEVVKSRHLANPETVNHQLGLYRDLGMPKKFGLWECAVLVWSPSGLQFGRDWLTEVNQHTLRDQLSFPYLVWSQETQVKTLPGHSRQNPYTRWRAHRKHR